MRYRFLLGVLVLAAVQSAPAAGLLVPDDVKLPPLAMVNHKVTVAIEDQVAVTTVEQAFRNHTDRNLEATYLFPVPRGASVNKFTMWVDGKETTGELLDAKKAHQVYTDIVRRTQDPGLLEYLGNDLMRLKVFPVLPRKDQKVRISFTSVAPMEQGVVEYVYPLRTDGKATRTLEEFSVKLTIKSQHPVQSVYSPTHAIDLKRKGDNEVAVEFEKSQALLDKDFQLFYGLGKQEIGLTPLTYRPVTGDDGYFMLLISPQIGAMKATRVPRDLVLVLDTSGSMSDLKMSQAKKALKHLLSNLDEGDRFGLIGFASTVHNYESKLLSANSEQLERARKWVDDLRAGGGTAIQPALDAALDMRTKDPGRSFTIAFFTDGMPTIDERDPAKIVKNVTARADKSENVRIFTFGVGDDVNATMLDQLADATRAVSTYVRPAEDIETKAAALNAKISHPVMTNVKLTTTNVKLSEMYPPKLPDLFHGGQLVVIGRYTGQGASAVKLTGMVGAEERELVYELTFPVKAEANGFVEHLWARRKVGYLLDQIRASGESKEVVEEVTTLAKKYGIATPYTSYLVVPDAPLPVIRHERDRFVPLGGLDPSNGPQGAAGASTGTGISGAGGPGNLSGNGGIGGIGGGFGGGFRPPGLVPAPRPGALRPTTVTASPKTVTDYAREQAAKPEAKGNLGAARGTEQDRLLEGELRNLPADKRDAVYADALKKAQSESKTFKDAADNYSARRLQQNQQGTLGVDLSLSSNALREQNRLTATANQQVGGRNCVEIGGVWIDDKFTAQTKTVAVKAQSDAYFRILEKQPQMKDVFRLGNHLVWLTPSGTGLVIDANDGKDKLTDAEIDALFAAAKK
ncbi:VIT domain-containing protein [Fimbriiglobus ruber]|uniref:von Willebrand factor type A domain protein n=1 Tax=Fimbriiglobus ruber TaxID=1908690 RepID=A0A225EG97_9BACT|nr:VIT domain-containing protein [Fimbriiglobus ruber]OWK47257.1 hypothetical protein FRUB_00956 [Fimbriiglobus ruber]